MSKKEPLIGEVVPINGKNYRCMLDKKGRCQGCAFQHKVCQQEYECIAYDREDGKSIILIEVE